jgi:phospholipid-transporting ATPase
LNDSKHENWSNINLYLTCLATCHTVITDAKEIKDVVYQSSSPDEMALVNAARHFKYFFTGRDIHNNVYLEINGKQVSYQLLNLLEYSSERKRMSVILKCPDNKIRLFSKGADSIIRERVTENPEMIKETDNFLMHFAQKGLRTLMVAYKEISVREYEDFCDNYRKAMDNPLEKDRLLPDVFDKIEQGLYLLGSTAIEDQLQDNVDQVLADFIETGIKVWVLTGDKTDTAKSIAFSCKLITHQFVLFEFKEKSSANEIREKMIDYMKRIQTDNENKQIQINTGHNLDNENIQEENVEKNNKKYALIVSIDEITRIMKNKDLEEVFYQLAIRCNTVLCCRVTPKQKAQMVNMVKERQPNTTTLAIGDGANDVNMITSAHIGIGILGVEGRQASRASDYSIAQFQYLKRLLFVHGRESYRKNSYVVCYNFYKNVLFVMPQFWFGFVSYFSGQTLYDPWIYQFYNIIFTCLPIIWFGIYDKEVSYDILMKDTRYYVQGIVGKLFHSIRFWKWVLYGMMQGVLVYLFSYNANRGAINTSGFQQDLFSGGSMAYSSIVLIVNVKILVSTCTHSFISFGLFFYSVISYYVTLKLMSSYHKFENFNNFEMNFQSLNFYFSTLLIVLVSLFVDVGVKRILLAFGLVVDPLEVKADQYEPNTVELKHTVIEEEVSGEVNNQCIF